MLTKKNHCKSLAKKTRGWLDSKDWAKIEKIQREVIIEDLLKYKKVYMYLGIYELVNSAVRTINKINTTDKIEVGGGKRMKYSPAPFFKERLNGEKPR
jgi:nucleoid DNA-binding protein